MGTTASEEAVPEGDAGLKAALHRIFDGQIPNYGDYNLVCAVECGGTTAGPIGSAPAARGLVLGYRRRPVELVVAPFYRDSLGAAGQPLTVDLTNLAYAAEGPGQSFDVATSTGRVVTFTLREFCTLPLDGVECPLRQADDADDLASFLRELTGL